jgi:hypothetical protein
MAVLPPHKKLRHHQRWSSTASCSAGSINTAWPTQCEVDLINTWNNHGKFMASLCKWRKQVSNTVMNAVTKVMLRLMM